MIHDSEGNTYQDLTAWHLNQPDKQDEEPKKIYFVRHGATIKNEEGTDKHDQPVRGWSTDSLDETGRADAEKAAENIRGAGLPVEHIVASDLPRAAETASTISRKLGIPLEFDPGLRTWDLGAYTGKSGKDVHDAVDRLCLRANDEKPPPGETPGESFNEFKDRILGTMSHIIQRHKDKELLIVSHNSPERVLHAWDAAGQPEAKLIDRLDPNQQGNIEDRRGQLPGSFRNWGRNFYDKEQPEVNLPYSEIAGHLPEQAGYRDIVRNSPEYKRLAK